MQIMEVGSPLQLAKENAPCIRSFDDLPIKQVLKHGDCHSFSICSNVFFFLPEAIEKKGSEGRQNPSHSSRNQQIRYGKAFLRVAVLRGRVAIDLVFSPCFTIISLW